MKPFFFQSFSLRKHFGHSLFFFSHNHLSWLLHWEWWSRKKALFFLIFFLFLLNPQNVPYISTFLFIVILFFSFRKTVFWCLLVYSGNWNLMEKLKEGKYIQSIQNVILYLSTINVKFISWTILGLSWQNDPQPPLFAKMYLKIDCLTKF